MVKTEDVYTEKSRVINTRKGILLTCIIDFNWLDLVDTNGMHRRIIQMSVLRW
jgi:hypothetical protein